MSELGDAVAWANQHHPLPRCSHGAALQDASGERLEPPCGCRVPMPAILHCPSCHQQHVDKGEFVARPHHRHRCANVDCGFVWRVEPYCVGVAGVKS